MFSCSLTEDALALSSGDLNCTAHDLDNLFDLHKRAPRQLEAEVEEEEVIHIGQFLKSLEATGIRRTDPRLKELMDNITAIKKESFADMPIESLLLDRMQFKRYVLALNGKMAPLT